MIFDKLSPRERVELMSAANAYAEAKFRLGATRTQEELDEAAWLVDWTNRALLDLVYGPVNNEAWVRG